MPTLSTYPQLIQLQKKNILALQSYLLAIEKSTNSFITEFYKCLHQEKIKIDEGLTCELFKNDKKYFESHTLENVLVDSWFDFHLIRLNDEEEILEAVLLGEERAVNDYKEVLANDLSPFGDMRDLLQMHTFKVQKLISGLQEIS